MVYSCKSISSSHFYNLKGRQLREKKKESQSTTWYCTSSFCPYFTFFSLYKSVTLYYFSQAEELRDSWVAWAFTSYLASYFRTKGVHSVTGFGVKWAINDNRSSGSNENEMPFWRPCNTQEPQKPRSCLHIRCLSDNKSTDSTSLL